MIWRPGQHLLLIGTTGSGKTYLALELLKLRRWVLAATTKRDTHLWQGFQTVANASQVPSVERLTERKGRWRLHPTALTDESLLPTQSREIGKLLGRAYQDGGWTVFVDELFYCVDRLKLENSLVALVSQGRSEGISFVGGVQRPSEVRWFLSESRYVVAFRMGSDLDRKTLGEHFGREWASDLADLPEHTASVMDKVTGESFTGKARDIAVKLGGGP